SGAYFRAERPQKGRYRQFYQVGIEAIGLEDPLIDAEVIWLADQAFKNIGLKNYRLEITSLGDAESRAAHRKDLLKFYETLNLDEATATRAKLNPLRLFDDKRPEMVSAMQKAPVLLDYLNEKSKDHFAKVREYLEQLGVKYEINSRLVRGFDYYTGTTFEFIHTGLGAQSAIGGGGRYDKLMSELGGQDLSGIGWGLGVDRTILAAEDEGVIPSDLGNPDLFIIPLGTQSAALKIATELRVQGKVVEIAFGDRALKGAMKAADKSGAKFLVVLGESEVTSGDVELKTMSSGDTKRVRISDLLKNL
ncbi:MAG: histidine--tRNA ligase, partial [Candidatus Nanopelagicaceae bacterium]